MHTCIRPGTTEAKPFRALSVSRKGRITIVTLDGKVVTFDLPAGTYPITGRRLVRPRKTVFPIY